MVKFGSSSTFRRWVRVLGYGSGVRGGKVKSRDCALASDLVRALPDVVAQFLVGNIGSSRAARFARGAAAAYISNEKLGRNVRQYSYAYK